MREDPGLDVGEIVACLDAQYDLRVASVTFLPIGYDLNAAVYEVISGDETSYFLKIRSGPVHEPGLLVPRALMDRGITNVLAPLRTRSSDLWCSLDGSGVVLYPFIKGENAMVAGMSDSQWRAFGATLQAVHSSGLAERFRGQLPVETFSLPSAAVIRRLLAQIDGARFESAAAARFAVFWRENAERIHRLLTRAEALGTRLQTKSFKRVLCHADIHAANILLGEGGEIFLVDWDGPLIAPRERDLLFVVGSRIARVVEPHKEAHFFEGYGPVEIDPLALAYYRYERVIEDIGEFGKSVFLDRSLNEQARAEEAALVERFFAPGGDIDLAETVTLHHSSVPPP